MQATPSRCGSSCEWRKKSCPANVQRSRSSGTARMAPQSCARRLRAPLLAEKATTCRGAGGARADSTCSHSTAGEPRRSREPTCRPLCPPPSATDTGWSRCRIAAERRCQRCTSRSRRCWTKQRLPRAAIRAPGDHSLVNTGTRRRQDFCGLSRSTPSRTIWSGSVKRTRKQRRIGRCRSVVSPTSACTRAACLGRPAGHSHSRRCGSCCRWERRRVSRIRRSLRGSGATLTCGSRNSCCQRRAMLLWSTM
mmetsp:Transcript_13545/g.47194  ORF Transcript_13545/g.47194 Transcript_13545/m.47194 type:complete len:251 (+) Transcript_13545:605-1357(+)